MACEQATTPAAQPEGESQTGTPEATTVPLTPEELMAKSFVRMALVTSFSTHFDAEIESEGQSFSGSGDISVSEDGHMKLNAIAGASDFQIGFGAKVVPPDVYISIPFLGWHRIPPEEFGPTSDIPSVGELMDGVQVARALVSSFDLPWEVLHATSLGREEVDGVDTEHLALAIDPIELYRVLQEDDLIDRLKAILPGESEHLDQAEHDVATAEEIEADLANIRITSLEGWVDNEGLLRKGLLDVSIDDGDAGTFTLKLEVEMSDFDEPVNVDAPSQFTEGLPGGDIPGMDMFPALPSQAPLQLQ